VLWVFFFIYRFLNLLLQFLYTKKEQCSYVCKKIVIHLFLLNLLFNEVMIYLIVC